MYFIYNNTGTSKLSSIYFNGNFKVSDIIVFRKNNYIPFETKQDAIDFLENKILLVQQQTHYIDGLKIKLLNRLEKLKNNIF